MVFKKIYLIKKFSIKIFFSAFFLLTTVIYPQEQSLKEVFKDHFLIGAAVNYSDYTNKDEKDTELIKKHFNTITAENELKWERVHPEFGRYNFEITDPFVEFGEKNNMFIVGHTLVWHSQTPQWVFKNEDGSLVNRETLLSRLKEHISTVVGRYKGRIHGWDVVNEALNEDGTLRESLWYKIIGEDYIEKAFQFAYEADPDAELYYNDYSLENEPKRNGAIKLVKNLLDKGIKVSAIGSQLHAKMFWPSMEQIDSTIKAFADLGVKAMITELDIDLLPQATQDMGADISQSAELQEKLNPYKDNLPDSMQNALAERYADFFKVFVENSDKLSRVTFWGVTDKDSWLNYWPVFGRTSYPLLFDRDHQPKEAFYRVIETAEK